MSQSSHVKQSAMVSGSDIHATVACPVTPPRCNGNTLVASSPTPTPTPTATPPPSASQAPRSLAIPSLVIVEGNISSGKSTICRELSQILNMKEWSEPVVDNPYLDKFYANPRAYALKMQLWLLRHRFLTYLDAIHHVITTTAGAAAVAAGAASAGSSTSSGDHNRHGHGQPAHDVLASASNGVLLDRSIFSDYVFAEKNYRDGNITAEGFAYYNELRERMLSCLPLPALTLYLDVNPKQCYDRIHNMRCRDCETGIQLDYLQGLDECYQVMLRHMEQSGGQVVRVNWNSFGNVKHVGNQLWALIQQKKQEQQEQLQQSQQYRTQMQQELDRVLRLVNSEELRRSAMYLDYTIAELENDEVAAAIATSSRTTSPVSTPTKSASSAPQLVLPATPSTPPTPTSPLVPVKNN